MLNSTLVRKKSTVSFYCFISGFSLIEIIIALAILGILLSISLPSFSSLIYQSHIEDVRDKYVTALKFAKETAVLQNTTVTFCKSDDGLKCGGDWINGSIAFTDYNSNAIVEDGEDILYRIEGNTYVSKIYWRSFRNRAYLQITSTGFTNNQSGNFTFCSANNEIKQARQLIINRVGRLRLAKDTDNDGIQEDSQGRPLRC